MALFSILVDIGARTANIEEALTRVEGRITSFAGALQTLGGAIGVGALAAFADHIIELGSQIEHASVKAGVTTTAFQELAFAAKQSGVESGGLDSALIKMNRSLSLASTGGKTQNDTLHALGLTFEQLKDLSPDKQFEIIADRISKLATPADRARAEMVLFGRAGGELGDLIMKGAAGIEEMRKQAESLGGVMSDVTVKNLEEAHRSIDRMETSFSALAGTLIGKVAPSLTGFFNLITAGAGGDKVSLLQMQLDSLTKKQNDIAEQGAKGGLWGAMFGPGAYNTGAIDQQIRRVTESLEMAKGLQAMVLKPEDLTGQSGRFQSLLGQNAPGYQATETPDLSVHPLLKGRKVDKTGFDALLAQWDQETVGIEDKAAATYDMTTLKLKELLAAGVIDLKEFDRRLHEAGVQYNAIYDQLQPIQITAKKIFPLDSLQLGIKQFTADFDSAMVSAIHSSGNFASNFLHTLLTSFEDKAIFSAIDDIGKALESMLLQSAASGGWLGGLAAALGLGSLGGGGGGGAAGSAGSAGTGFGGQLATGGFVASSKTYLVGERGPELFTSTGSGQITPIDQVGGGAIAFSPTYNIIAPNGDQQLRNALPGLLQQVAARTKKDMLEAFRRNNLPSPSSA